MTVKDEKGTADCYLQAWCRFILLTLTNYLTKWKKTPLHFIFFIDCATFDTENTSSVPTKCADGVIFDMEKDSAAQDKSTGAVSAIGDIIVFVLNITSPGLNITGLSGDGSSISNVAIMQRAF